MALFILFASLGFATLVGMLIKHRATIEVASVAATVGALAASLSIAMSVAANGAYAPNGFFSIDALDAIVMLIVATVAVACTVYSIPYLRKETAKEIIGFNRVRQYYVLLHVFLMAMFVATATSSPIMTWIAIEATTLSTAFLISFYNKSSAVEAAWKYLIINAVGLLLAFFGTLLYFTAVGELAGEGLVSWSMLAQHAANLNPLIAKVGFIFVLIGYGTKVGFAPMHTWKPDAYSKAPSPLGALFSGALLPVAFITILKFKVITDSVVGSEFSEQLFIVFGLLSMAIAAAIMFVARNYKRLLAYSSIKNAGIIALGFGFGGIGVYAAVLHLVYHSLIKAALFMNAGALLLKYSSTKIEKVRGALTALPVTSMLLIVGFLSIIGMPPFGIFFTELMIIAAGIATHWIVVSVVLLLLAIVFIGFFKHLSAMSFGEKPAEVVAGEQGAWLVIPPFVLLVVMLVLSVYIPPFLLTLLKAVVATY